MKDTERVLNGLEEGMRSDMSEYWKENEWGTCSACLAGVFLGLRCGGDYLRNPMYASVMDFLNCARLPSTTWIRPILNKLDIVVPEVPPGHDVDNSRHVVNLLNELLRINNYPRPLQIEV